MAGRLRLPSRAYGVPPYNVKRRLRPQRYPDDGRTIAMSLAPTTARFFRIRAALPVNPNLALTVQVQGGKASVDHGLLIRPAAEGPPDVRRLEPDWVRLPSFGTDFEEPLPWTGRRTLVTDAFVAVVRERLQAIAGALPAGRKANKILSEVAAVFARHRPRLAGFGLDESFAAVFGPRLVRS
ncbi:MAG: hypothetical protein HY905_24125 [Deltaproteobacteria bacterium]|nr:hypothetical protein [Deltaproteobacteria bacterium]